MKTLQNFMKANSVISLVAVVVVGYLLYNYSTKFSGSMNSFSSGGVLTGAANAVENAMDDVGNAVKSVAGVHNEAKAAPTQDVKPDQLLPLGESANMAFEQLMPIATQRSKNPNLQLRSEHANPKMDVGPWNATSIKSDTYRRPLEIGGSCGGM